MATAMQALQTPRRREILRLVWDRERSAGEIREEFPDVTFGAVSQHLRTLRDAGLVRRRRAGRRVFYRAERAALGPLAEWLEQQWDSALYRLRLLAELEEARRGPRSANSPPGSGDGISARREDEGPTGETDRRERARAATSPVPGRTT